MDDRIQKLLDLAFRVEPAAAANVAIAEVRESEGGPEPVRSYELVFPADATVEWLAEKAVPRLVYHLESLKARAPGYSGVVISIFAGERLLFVRAADFLPAVAGLLGCSVDELYRRHGTGELRTAVRDQAGLPALLPGKRD